MAGKAVRAAIPLLEWVFAAIGLVLVVGATGFIAWHGLTRGSSPPDISLRAEGVAAQRHHFVVTITATNLGATTAKGLKVEGELKRGTEVVESSEMSFDYLPPDSRRKGGLMFTNDPRRYELTLTAKGYEVP